MLLSPDRAEKIVMACVVLHNFLRQTSRSHYCPLQALDREDVENGVVHSGTWRLDGGMSNARPISSNSYSAEGRRIRLSLCEYVNGPGSVSWQNFMVTSDVTSV